MLGAFGCGVFGNDPYTVARGFKGLLTGEFNGAFTNVIFAVLDNSANQMNIKAFEEVFS